MNDDSGSIQTAGDATRALKRILNDQLIKVNTSQLFDDNTPGGGYKLDSTVWLAREDPRRADLIEAIKADGWTISEWGAFFSATRPKPERKGNAARGEAFLSTTFPTKPEPF